VRHKHHGFFRGRPQLKQLLVQLVPYNFIERPKGFIHQQQLGLNRQRPRNGNPLLHSARQLPRKLLLKTAEVHQFQIALDPCCGIRRPHDLQRQPHILFHCAPRIKRRRLKHIAIGPRHPCLRRAHAIHRHGAARRLFQIGNHPQKRGLAAARRADEGNKIPVIHREADPLQGKNWPVSRGEREAQITCVYHGLSRHNPSPGNSCYLRKANCS
jgi:hypothetical protein